MPQKQNENYPVVIPSLYKSVLGEISARTNTTRVIKVINVYVHISRLNKDVS